MMSLRRMLVGSLAFASFAHVAGADTLHSFGGLFWHHDSGWQFPERIGEFERVGMPQDVAGSADVNTHYAHVAGGKRVATVMDVYGVDSALSEPTFALAKQAFEREFASRAHEVSSELPLRVGGARSYAGTKVVFKVADEALPLRVLYFVAMGDWIVKVRVAIPSDDQRLVDAADAFVHALRWDSLGSAPPLPAGRGNATAEMTSSRILR